MLTEAGCWWETAWYTADDGRGEAGKTPDWRQSSGQVGEDDRSCMWGHRRWFDVMATTGFPHSLLTGTCYNLTNYIYDDNDDDPNGSAPLAAPFIFSTLVWCTVTHDLLEHFSGAESLSIHPSMGSATYCMSAHSWHRVRTWHNLDQPLQSIQCSCLWTGRGHRDREDVQTPSRKALVSNHLHAHSYWQYKKLWL